MAAPSRSISLHALLAGAVALSAALAPLAASASDMTAPPAPGWKGCYVGVNVGYVHGESDIVDKVYAQGPFAGVTAWNTPAGETLSPESDGVIGGGVAGCDLVSREVSGTTIVLGVVGDLSALEASGASVSVLADDTTAAVEANWLATLRGRIGATSGPALFYLTGGVAFSEVEISATDTSDTINPGTMRISGSDTKAGWVAGAGIEWMLSAKTTLSFEYLHASFDDVVATGEASNIPGAYPRFEGDLDLDIVRLGLNWRM